MFQIKLQIIFHIIKFQIREGKVRWADLQAEAAFMQKKRYAELQTELLWVEEEMANTKAWVKIYEGGSTDQKVASKTLTMTDIKVGDSRYPVITMKQNYLDQNEKSSTATQFQAGPRVNKFSTTNNQQGELQDKQRHLQGQ